MKFYKGTLNMKRYNNPVKQQGVVLAFVLVMLLLLTTISVNMIQQNQQNLATANNARQQVAVLSTAETTVLGSGAIIEGIRYADKAIHKCKAAGQIDQGSTIGTSTVIGVYCMWRVGGAEKQCRYTGSPLARVATDSDCAALTQAGSVNGCPVEIYTLETSSIGDKGAKRTIQSKYAVDCTGDTG
jgi:hypothetical protein